MKKFMIMLILFTAGITAPGVVKETKAQVVERKVERGQRRRVRRRTRRRVRRRVHRRAHLRYAHLPKYRAVVNVVPGGAVIVKKGGITYRYYSGVYYMPQGDVFVVARPVIGVRVATLPAARRKIIIANTTYYYYYGSFYVEKNNEYEVVEAPEGALVDALPDGYEVKEVDGTEYYVLDDVYYQEVETDELEDGVGYEVVKV